MHSLFFVTGASGTGKTTVVKGLKARRPDIVFRYFDTIGLPSQEEMAKEFGNGERWQRPMSRFGGSGRTFWVGEYDPTRKLLARSPMVPIAQNRVRFDEELADVREHPHV